MLSLEQRLAVALLTNAHVAMWACDRQFRIVLWNYGAEEIYGITAEEAIGKNYLEMFVDEAEQDDSLKDCIRIIDGGKRFKNFLAYDHDPDGKVRYMLTNGFRIVDPDTGERYAAEVGVEISDLELRRNEHRTLRELGIARAEGRKSQLKRERDELLFRVGRIQDEARYVFDRISHDLDAFVRASGGRSRAEARRLYNGQVERLTLEYRVVQAELEKLALRSRSASSLDDIQALNNELGEDPRRWTDRLRLSPGSPNGGERT